MGVGIRWEVGVFLWIGNRMTSRDEMSKVDSCSDGRGKFRKLKRSFKNLKLCTQELKMKFSTQSK